MAVDFTPIVHYNNEVKMRNVRGDGTDMNDNREVMEIDLKRLVRILWRRAWAIVLVAVLMAALAFSYAWFLITPQYSANVRLYVNNNYSNSPGFSSSQIAAAQNLADTYMVILESRSIMEEVAAHTGLSYSYNQLVGMVSASAVNETEIFQVDVTCSNYKHAAQIANAIAEVLPEKITSVVEGSSVRVVDYAVENSRQVSPNYQRYAMLGAVLGVVLSAALIIVMDLMDTSINSEEYLTAVYHQLPLLAVIPDAQQSGSSSYYKGYYEAETRKQPSKKDGGEQ